MAFLAPLFLAALAALAVPIVLHLAHRERRQPVRFPSLAFVRRVPFRTTERRRIRDWLLLLLRAGAVALLVIAFARPFFATGDLGAAALGSAREIVVLVDRSASMAYGNRWSRAAGAARAAIRGLGPEDRATLVLFDEVPEVTVPATADPALLDGALATARPGGATTRYAPALQLAGDLLEQSSLPERIALLITDFQRVGWDGQADVRLPAGVSLQHVVVGDDQPANLAVTDVALDRSPADGGRVTVTARVANLGAEAATARARLGTHEQTLQEATVTVPAGDAVPVTFAPIALPPGPTPAWVALDGDPLPLDDRRSFVLRPIPTIRVLLVEPRGAPDRETVYLRRALEIGRDPAIALTVRSGSFTATDLRGQAAVILNDAPFPADEAGRALGGFVAAGGGLLWALGPRAGAPPSAWRGVIGSAAGGVTDRLSDRGGTLGIADYGHPLFAPFRESRGGDFSAIRVFRYRRLEVPDSAVVLAWMDDGGAVLAEVRHGAGRALLWGSDFGNRWNDLPLRAVFLPTAHEAIRHLTGHREPPITYRVGHALELSDLDIPPDVDLIFEAPDGGRTALDERRRRSPLSLRQPGFYTLRRLDGSGPGIPIAVSVDPSESDLTSLDQEGFLAAAAGPPGERTGRTATHLGAADRERRQRLWWYLALGAVVALASESVVAAFRPRRVNV
jgi:hypothetical protein